MQNAPMQMRCALLLASAVALWSLARPQDAQFPSLPAPAPKVLIQPGKLDQLDQLSCTKCHEKIVEEWSSTAHALAWVDPEYQSAIKEKRKPEACHACHIPQPLSSVAAGARPEPRKDALHFGVSCDACHLAADGAMLGPVDVATPTAGVHASRRADTLASPGTSALCATCHRTSIGPVIGIAKDFESADKAAAGDSCVGCHFAAEREVTDASGAKRLVRSHALQTPRDPVFLARAFGTKLSVEKGTTVVTISNLAGHRVPGLIGREIDFEAHLLDAQGKTVATGKQSLSTTAPMPVSDGVRIEIAGTGARVHLVGRHTDPRADKPVVFLERDLQP
jgi:hypothetical protein